jgi:4-amino-4-deoxy-L-arabinose transferase-like glycosyltransferase
MGKKTEIALVLVMLAAAVALRMWGLWFGFPDYYRPDEEYFANSVASMDRTDLNPHFFYYPHGYMYFNLVLWRGYVLGRLLLHQYYPPQGISQIYNAIPHILYLLGRLSSVLFGSLTVLMLYLLGRRFYGVAVGLIGGFFLAINPTHVLNSHFYKSDIATAFFIIAALYFLLAYIEQGRRGNYIAAAILSGVATASNYYGGFLLAPLALALFFRAHKEKKKLYSPFAAWELYVAPVIVAVVFYMLSPYTFVDFHSFLEHFHRMLFADRVNLFHTLRLAGFREYGFLHPLLYGVRFDLRYELGILMTLFSLAGFVYLLFKPSHKTYFLLFFLVLFYCAMATGKAIFMRYHLPTIPILCLIAAIVIVRLSGVLRRKAASALLAIFLAAALAAEPLWYTIQSDRLLTRTDTRTLAREWIHQNLPSGAKLAANLAYRYGKPQLRRGMSFVDLKGSMEDLYRHGVHYVYVDESPLFLYSRKLDKSVEAQLKEKAMLLQEIDFATSGTKKTNPVFDQLDAFYVPVAGFGGIERPGPRIRIFEIKPPGVLDAQPTRKAYETGLRGAYYSNTKLSGEPTVRMDAEINFDWGPRAPAPAVNPDNFSVRWTGEIQCPVDAVYTFYVRSDDGARLWIDDQQILDNWKEQSPTEVARSRFTQQGWHRIRLEYFEATFGASIRLAWSYAQNPKAIIPPSNLRALP